MPASRQHLKSDRHPVWSTYKVQSPAVEAPLLGSAFSDVVSRPRKSACTSVESLATSTCSYYLTHRNGHTIYDKGVPLSRQPSNKLYYVFQSTFSRESVQPPAKARCGEVIGDVAHTFHHEQSPFVVVLEVHRGDYSYQQYLGIADASEFMGTMSKFSHCILDDAQSGYNLYVVHVVPPLDAVLGTNILEQNHLDAQFFL